MTALAAWLLYLSFLAVLAVLGWRKFNRSVLITSSVLILIWVVSWVYVDREMEVAFKSGTDMGASMAGGMFLIFVTMLTAVPAVIGLTALNLRRLVKRI